MIHKGDRVKIISQNKYGTVIDILITRFADAEKLEDVYSGCYVVNDGKNTFYVTKADLEKIDEDKEYMVYRISRQSSLKIEFPTSPFDDIKASIESTFIAEIVEKIDKEIIKKYEEIAVRNGINDLILLSESQIKRFLTKYLPIYIEEMGLKQ